MSALRELRAKVATFHRRIAGEEVMDAPKRIWGIPHRDDESPHSLGVFWSVQCSEDDDEYILASEHDRLMTEQAAKIERLREALGDIARQKKTDELETEYDVECADFEGGYDAIIDEARAALGGDNG